MNKRNLICLLTGMIAGFYVSGCDDSPVRIRCELGESQCLGKDMRVCVNHEWTTIPCPNGCDDSTNACVKGDGDECVIDICKDSKTLYHCNESHVIEIVPCKPNEVCQADICIPSSTNPECKPGDIKCSDDNRYVMICDKDGFWRIDEHCAENMLCDMNEHKCRENAVICNGDEIKCSDNGESAMVCIDNDWKIEDCTPGICKNGICERCSLTEQFCSDENKVLDKENCRCVIPGPGTSTCHKTQADCDADGKILDTALCECVTGGGIPGQCELTQADCEADGKVLSSTACQCVAAGVGECHLTEAECEADGKILDSGICDCVVAHCELDPASCTAEGLVFDNLSCSCTKPACELDDYLCARVDKLFDPNTCSCYLLECDIAESDCLSKGQIFDAMNCTCTDPYCDKNAEICQAMNRTFDKATCSCICGQSEQSCQSRGLAFDEVTCTCYKDCGLYTEAYCNSQKKFFDEKNCKCVDCLYNNKAELNPIKCETSYYYANQYQYCTSSNTWSSSYSRNSCPSDKPVCDDSVWPNRCVKQCKDGDKRCNGYYAQTCNKGTWSSKNWCYGGVQCSNGDCVECVYDPDPAKNAIQCRSTGNAIDAGSYLVCTPEGKWDTWENFQNCPLDKPVCFAISGTSKCIERCTDGDVRCEGNVVVQCQNSIWKNLKTCLGNEPTCSKGQCLCVPDATQCGTGSEADLISTCQADFTWGPAVSCPEGTVCRSGKCEERCNSGEFKCGGTNGTTIYECRNYYWNYKSFCSGDTPICREGKCLCNEGEMRCGTNEDAGKVKYCQDGVWSELKDCPEGQICEQNHCIDRCPENGRQCNDKYTQICVDGLWKDETHCEGETPTCVDGTCGCMPNSQKCGSGEDAKLIKTCNADGTWGELTSCPTGQICYNNSCVESCEEGETKCNNPSYSYSYSYAYTCVNGHWDSKRCSSPNSYCTNGECGCRPGTKQCDSNGKIQICQEDGKWSTPQDCSEGQVCVSGVCTDACNEGETKCYSSSIVYKCTNQKWSDDRSCSGTTPVCKDGVCVCTPGAHQCTSDGKIQTCLEDNTWGEAVDCSEGMVCSGGACIEACPEGERRCSSSKAYQICSDGVWKGGTTCSGSTPTCTNGKCGCTPGKSECGSGSNSTKVRICQEDGTWSTYDNCEEGKICSGNACIDKCIEGATKCSGSNKFQTCTGGLWGSAVSCDAQTPSCINDKCGCTPGTTRCANDGLVETCQDNGEWGAPESCPNDMICSNNSCGEKCIEGATRCYSSVSMQTCIGGLWKNLETCTGDTPVCVNNKCNCEKGKRKCDGNSIVTCQDDGSWGSPVACGAGHTCVDGRCSSSCSDGRTRCNGTSTIEICENNTWKVSMTCSGEHPHCDSNLDGAFCTCLGGSCT